MGAPYLGDFLVGASVHGWYNTNSAAGASITRGTDGTLSVYKDANDTQTTTGVTSGEDTDGLTGAHRYTIVTTDSFYVPGSNYAVVLSAAGIDSQTVNAVVGHFSIQNRAYPGLIARGLAQSATATTIVLASTTSYANDLINGATIVIVSGTGIGQSRIVTDWVSASDTATVDTWITNPDSTSYYEVVATPPASTSVPLPVNTTQFGGSAITSSSGRPEVNTSHIAGSSVSTSSAQIGVNIVNVAGSAVNTSSAQLGVNIVNAGGVAWGSGAITAAAIGTNAITADKVDPGVGSEIATAVLTAAASDPIHANVQEVNDVVVAGDGSLGNEWGP